MRPSRHSPAPTFASSKENVVLPAAAAEAVGSSRIHLAVVAAWSRANNAEADGDAWTLLLLLGGKSFLMRSAM